MINSIKVRVFYLEKKINYRPNKIIFKKKSSQIEVFQTQNTVKTLLSLLNINNKTIIET
jgi:hypothetical protein